MIKSYKDNNQQLIVILQPNASLSWSGNLVVLGLFLFSFMLIAGLFLFLGTWLIIPFAGLELLLLGLCLYAVNKKSYSQEVITLSDDAVKVEKGYRSTQQSWVFKRFFCRVYIKHSSHPWQQDKIQIGTHQTRILIGSQLPLAEQQQLKKILVSYVHYHSS